jgi:FAD/FMN-containing dehydrogenase
MGLGPVALSVRSITLVLASGEVRQASPQENSELFYAAIGGYGAIGIIAEAELELVPNTRVQRGSVKMETKNYPAWFDVNVRGRKEITFHNADLYPPLYTRARRYLDRDRPAGRQAAPAAAEPRLPGRAVFPVVGVRIAVW